MTKRPTKRPRVALVTLGCAKNVVDSERIASILEAAGVEVTADPAGASVAVVNTCGFIESAKQESIDAILEAADWKAAHGLETLIVTGCLAQRYGDELRASLPEADLLLGVDPPAAASTVLRALGIEAPAPCPASRQRAHRLTPPAWCYLKIAEGCDNRCAYCAVPLIRGPMVSRPLEEVVEEARGLLAEGQKLVEPTSGNTGMGLAMMANAKGYPLATPLSKAIPAEKRTMLRFFGTDVEEFDDTL